MSATVHATAAAAKTVPIDRSRSRINPIGRGITLWHLFSLDAPSVAMLWTWFLARECHITLPITAVLAMGIAVWMLYAADRLLDTRLLDTRASSNAVILPLPLNEVKGKGQNPRISPDAPQAHSDQLEPRHYFHRNHQNAFRLAILLASILLAGLLPGLAPQSIRLYLVLGTLLFGYFVLIHAKPSNAQTKSHRLPKELAVGVFFSAATFIPTVARNPTLRLALLPGAILFAALCSLNCLFIYSWEHPSTSSQTHPATRSALRFLPHLTIAAAIAGLILSIADRSLPWPVPLACGIATALLLLLHKNSHRFSPTTLRAAADLCLLTPFLLLHF